MSVVLYLAMSRDGYIADEQGGVGFLDFTHDIGHDCGFKDFCTTIDGVVMGYASYKQLLEFGGFPYADKYTYVFTDQEQGVIEQFGNEVEFVSGDVSDVYAQIRERFPTQNIWLFGGANLIQQFYEHNLIDEYVLTVVSVDLHKGIRLPERILQEKKMKLVKEIPYEYGLEQRVYSAI